MSIRDFFLNTRIILKNIYQKLRKLILPDRFYTREFVDKKYLKNIGAKTYGHPIIYDFGDGGKLKIGNYCSIGDGVRILLGGNHHLEWISTYPFEVKGKSYTKGDVLIGNDVYIGMNALIFSGVTVGDGAVIGAGAIVTKDVAAYAVVAGNPAKLIRKRFSTRRINQLLKIKWWDWPVKKIERNVNLICSENFSKFLEISKNKPIKKKKLT